MTEEDQLEDRLRQLARVVPQTAGPAVEERLRRAFRARRNEQAPVWKYVAKLAASAVIGAGLYLGWTYWAHRRGLDQQMAAIAPVQQRPVFIALPYAQSDVPLEQPVIVRVQIPVSQLGGMGMPFAPMTATGRINADLLVGQDGVARAVRLVE
jgi:hypothetical protein